MHYVCEVEIAAPVARVVELMTDLYPDADIPATPFSRTKLSDRVTS